MRRVALAVAALALLLPAAAQAHPRLVTEPPFAGTVATRGPTAIVLVFDEAVKPVGAGIRVTGPNGRDAAAGPVRRAGRA